MSGLGPNIVLRKFTQAHAESATGTTAVAFCLSNPYDDGTPVEMSAPATGFEWALMHVHFTNSTADNVIELEDGDGNVVWRQSCPVGVGQFFWPEPGLRFGDGVVPHIVQAESGQIYADALFVQVPLLD